MKYSAELLHNILIHTTLSEVIEARDNRSAARPVSYIYIYMFFFFIDFIGRYTPPQQFIQWKAIYMYTVSNSREEIDIWLAL